MQKTIAILENPGRGLDKKRGRLASLNSVLSLYKWCEHAVYLDSSKNSHLTVHVSTHSIIISLIQ